MTALELRRSANGLNKRSKQYIIDLIAKVPENCFDEEAEISSLADKLSWQLLQMQQRIHDKDLTKTIQILRRCTMYRVKTFDTVNNDLSKLTVSSTATKDAYASLYGKKTLLSTFEEALKFQQLGENI